MLARPRRNRQESRTIGARRVTVRRGNSRRNTRPGGSPSARRNFLREASCSSRSPRQGRRKPSHSGTSPSRMRRGHRLDKPPRFHRSSRRRRTHPPQADIRSCPVRRHTRRPCRSNRPRDTPTRARCTHHLGRSPAGPVDRFHSEAPSSLPRKPRTVRRMACRSRHRPNIDPSCTRLHSRTLRRAPLEVHTRQCRDHNDGRSDNLRSKRTARISRAQAHHPRRSTVPRHRCPKRNRSLRRMPHQRCRADRLRRHNPRQIRRRLEPRSRSAPRRSSLCRHK